MPQNLVVWPLGLFIYKYYKVIVTVITTIIYDECGIPDVS